LVGFDHNLIRGAFEAAHGVGGKNSSALGGDDFGVFIANGSVVRDSGGGNYDGSQSGGRWVRSGATLRGRLILAG